MEKNSEQVADEYIQLLSRSSVSLLSHVCSAPHNCQVYSSPMYITKGTISLHCGVGVCSVCAYVHSS